ncbi:MAG: response regulator [Niameybacter sp.]|uniref:response regulator transcription factor n=1 Tax=Niameybacter sp. TaxID=2033640 RepID=UPI002FC75E95
MYKVLIIDDEVFIREGMRKVIPWHDLGCELVDEAQNGEEGIEKMIQHEPHIIISDIRMPKKSGLEMIDEMKSINQDIQIIILTGFREFEYAQQAIRLGVLRFLLKPSKLEEIKEAIVSAVANLEQLPKREVLLNPTLKEVENEDKGREELDKPQYLVRQAIDYINEHYDQKLDLQTVAGELYVSTWHLCKVIKKQTGTNFVDLLNAARIEKAKRLLLESNMKIYEIAENVGYTDTAYFSKIFKKSTQVTPNEYRNKMY